MHELIVGGRQIPYSVSKTVAERVAQEIVPRVPAEHWKESEEDLPLRYAESPQAISLALWPHCDGGVKRYAVYVLECINNQSPATKRSLYTTRSYWDGGVARQARRRIYVGRAKRVFQRLEQHLLDAEQGANFTQVYRPIRVLDVSWWRPYRVGAAEVEVAEQLQEQFPDDYVVQQ